MSERIQIVVEIPNAATTYDIEVRDTLSDNTWRSCRLFRNPFGSESRDHVDSIIVEFRRRAESGMEYRIAEYRVTVEKNIVDETPPDVMAIDRSTGVAHNHIGGIVSSACPACKMNYPNTFLAEDWNV